MRMCNIQMGDGVKHGRRLAALGVPIVATEKARSRDDVVLYLSRSVAVE